MECPGDEDAIDRVHRAAFPSPVEARLVRALRAHGRAQVSLVAEIDENIVGHVMFSPVTIVGRATPLPATGLAPLAVLPRFQRRGIGARLTHAGLEACRRAGCGFAVVLGHPALYARCGFERASERGLANDYGADEAFRVIELVPGALDGVRGLVRYAPEFAEL